MWTAPGGHAAFVGGLAPRRPAPVLLLAGAQPREKLAESGEACARSLSRGDVEATDTAACACVLPHPQSRYPHEYTCTIGRGCLEGSCLPKEDCTDTACALPRPPPRPAPPNPAACTAASGTHGPQTLAEISSQGERPAPPCALPKQQTANHPRGGCLRAQAHHSHRSGGSLQPPATPAASSSAAALAREERCCRHGEHTSPPTQTAAEK